MLSYRHGFHAGNPADVFKHATLCLVLRALNRKEKAWFCLDTHAGAGSYDLHSAMARQNEEFQTGIGRLWSCEQPEAVLHPYLDTIRSYNAGRRVLRYYPGSPAIIRAWMRPQDRMTACELHGSEITQLKARLAGPGIQVMQEDGYGQMRACLPPLERRGFVFCDPPYELKNEVARLGKAAAEAYKRWPSGTFLYWYPVTDSASSQMMKRTFRRIGCEKLLMAEFYTEPAAGVRHMTGSGLMIINPPWPVNEELPLLLGALEQHLLMRRETNRPLWQMEDLSTMPL
ncbi:MAG: rRNA ((2030)-N(6))-methyltransferase RlmJ [Pseudomonadota bacterium]